MSGECLLRKRLTTDDLHRGWRHPGNSAAAEGESSTQTVSKAPRLQPPDATDDPVKSYMNIAADVQSPQQGERAMPLEDMYERTPRSRAKGVSATRQNRLRQVRSFKTTRYAYDQPMLATLDILTRAATDHRELLSLSLSLLRQSRLIRRLNARRKKSAVLLCLSGSRTDGLSLPASAPLVALSKAVSPCTAPESMAGIPQERDCDGTGAVSRDGTESSSMVK